MSFYKEASLVQKLNDFSYSQQSIQTLSLWIIHHRRYYAPIVKTWLTEMMKATEAYKLKFFYLANDVIQNSSRKGPEFNKQFALVFPKAFGHISKVCTTISLFSGISHILQIWEDRKVYDTETIMEYRLTLHKEDSEDTDKNSDDNDNNDSDNRDTGTDADEETADISLPDAPEPEELIKAIQSVENAASCDAEIRVNIANLPARVSDLHYVLNLQDNSELPAFRKEVDAAMQVLNDYNTRLSLEMENRDNLQRYLQAFLYEQESLLAKAEARLKEQKNLKEEVVNLQEKIKVHFSNFPDLTSLPDVTAMLAPLPSACELFTKRPTTPEE